MDSSIHNSSQLTPRKLRTSSRQNRHCLFELPRATNEHHSFREPLPRPDTNFYLDDTWHPPEDIYRIETGKVGFPFSEDMLSSVLHLEDKRIEQRKHKRGHKDRERRHRSRKRRKLNADGLAECTDDERRRRKKKKSRDKDRKHSSHSRRRKRKREDSESAAETAPPTETGESMLNEDGNFAQSVLDPTGGLPYLWHLALHCEPDMTEKPQFIDIKQLLDPARLQTGDGAAHTTTESSTHNASVSERRNCLSLGLTPKEEQFVDQLVSNLDKLTARKSRKCKDGPLMVDISECIVLPQEPEWDEMSGQQIRSRIQSDMIKYNFLVHPTVPSPSPPPKSRQLSVESREMKEESKGMEVESIETSPLVQRNGGLSQLSEPTQYTAFGTPKAPPRPPLPLPAFIEMKPIETVTRNGTYGTKMKGKDHRSDKSGKTEKTKEQIAFSTLMLPNLQSESDDSEIPNCKGQSLLPTMAFG